MLVRENEAPSYTSGVIAMIVCYCVAIGLMGAYWLIALRLNKKTAATARAPTEGNPEEQFADETDFKQANFLYTT